MYEENGGFDQTINGELLVQADEDGFSQTHIPIHNANPNFTVNNNNDDNNNNYPRTHQEAISALEMELQNQLTMEINHSYNNNDDEDNNSNGIHQIIQEMSSFNNTNDYVQNGHFNIFPLPKYPSPSPNLLPNTSIAFSNPNKSSNFLASLGILGDPTTDIGSSGVVYDPLLPLNLPPQPPLLRDLFHSLPNATNGCLFSGVDERESGGGGFFYQGGENGVFEFTAGGDIECLGKNREVKDSKPFVTERHRRVLLNDKYQALRKLCANPTKNDRASIVQDAIDYINELKRSVAELKLLVEKKRCARERLKRLKSEDHDHDRDANNNESINGSKSLVDIDHPCNGSSLRSSWLHRKSKNTEVDVRIIDDEVTVKLVQQKRINCLLFVSKVLDELQLDLHHVAGGLIGDYYSFLFNSKICEGSIVYASAIANKLIEVVDKHYAAIPPTNTY